MVRTVSTNLHPRRSGGAPSVVTCRGWAATFGAITPASPLRVWRSEGLPKSSARVERRRSNRRLIPRREAADPSGRRQPEGFRPPTVQPVGRRPGAARQVTTFARSPRSFHDPATVLSPRPPLERRPKRAVAAALRKNPKRRRTKGGVEGAVPVTIWKGAATRAFDVGVRHVAQESAHTGLHRQPGWRWPPPRGSPASSNRRTSTSPASGDHIQLTPSWGPSLRHAAAPLLLSAPSSVSRSPRWRRTP